MTAEFLSVRQAAEQSKQKEAKIRNLIRQGKLSIVRVGYSILIPRSELRKLSARAGSGEQ